MPGFIHFLRGVWPSRPSAPNSKDRDTQSLLGILTPSPPPTNTPIPDRAAALDEAHRQPLYEFDGESGEWVGKDLDLDSDSDAQGDVSDASKEKTAEGSKQKKKRWTFLQWWIRTPGKGEEKHPEPPAPSEPAPQEAAVSPASPLGPFKVYILTWNIDFANPHPGERLQAALDHIQYLVVNLATADSKPYVLVLLQELHQHCFPILCAHPYIRENYFLTDIKARGHWRLGAHYGTVTLIPRDGAIARALPHDDKRPPPPAETGRKQEQQEQAENICLVRVQAVFRTPYKNSILTRDGLFVDVLFTVSYPHPHPPVASAPEFLLRVANTHLESYDYPSGNPRSLQLQSVAQYLKTTGVHAGIVAGDMNAHTDEDRGAPKVCALRDVWEEVRRMDGKGREGREETEETAQVDLGGRAEDHTWGFQPPRADFVPARLDKILLTGKVQAGSLVRVGYDMRYHHPEEVRDDNTDVVPAPADLWVSDHCGLLAEVMVG